MSAFLDLHRPGEPLVMPNPWDAGSARVLAAMGFRALATTSGGFAGTLGRPDGSVSREEALTHAAAVVRAVDVPVSADLENGSPTTRTGWQRRSAKPRPSASRALRSRTPPAGPTTRSTEPRS